MRPRAAPASSVSRAALTACRGTHPPPVYAWDQAANFSGMKTYAWYDGPGFKIPHGDSIIDGQFIDRTVRQAVDETLAKRGFQKVDEANASMSSPTAPATRAWTPRSRTGTARS